MPLIRVDREEYNTLLTENDALRHKANKLTLEKRTKLEKMVWSALISGGGVAVVLTLEALFPAFDWVEYKTAILTAIGAWVVNYVRETLGN
jgi:hypothetical protein